ncbi:MAG: SDR family NAD(P)-dependent oxidoreductase, partial [Pyrinomonadaceae bacterium]|nr:SDR family NAD(P)-dependent oxidoreductase [Pyrinomonadaceae bacterium]
MENQEFSGKVAIITGATSGIGRATAQKLASGGAKIIAVGRNETALQSLQNDSQTFNSNNLKVVKADVSNEADAQNIVSHTIEAFGAIDILVNAAG